MQAALVNGRVLLGAEFREGLAVVIDGDVIQSILPAAELPTMATVDLGGDLLLPGFIDTQVNGGAGVLFNDDPSLESIAAIGAAHRRFGTTGFLPTLISDDLDKIEQAMRAVEAAITAGVPGVLGIHIEGPFLSPERRGIHQRGKLRQTSDSTLALLTSLKVGKTLVTLAPEITGFEIIRELKNCGVVVAAGHTDASYLEIQAAIAQGVTGFTHLFNAMSPLTSREPGVVGAALEDASCWCGIIVDGHHVAPAVLKLALRARAFERFMLVTDAMPSVGSTDQEFLLQGQRIQVRNGACVDAEGRLAGAHIGMIDAVRNSVAMLDLPLPAAVQMASSSPADFLGMGKWRGAIAVGFQADLLQVTDHWQLRESWIGGRPDNFDVSDLVVADGKQ